MSYFSTPCYKSAIFSIHLFYFFLYTLYNDLSTPLILGNDQEKKKQKEKKNGMQKFFSYPSSALIVICKFWRPLGFLEYFPFICPFNFQVLSTVHNLLV